MLGLIEKETTKSSYAPSEDVKKLTAAIKKDYAIGSGILEKNWNEFNGATVIEDMNRGRMMFNAFVDESYDDPTESWKWRGTRSMARNKGIAMHANLTAKYLLPGYQAQNDDNEEDRGFSEFMTDLVEWMAKDDNSDYMPNFLSLVFAMESDPVVYLGAEYNEVMQDIRIKGEDGRYTKKEIMDEVLSGFKAPIHTAEQVLISNAFERNIQKHRFNGKRRWIEYDEAKAKYGTHPDFEFVKKGATIVFSQEEDCFYECYDINHPNMVEEFTYRNRRQDTEVCFLGGIYMGDADIEANPIKHRDNFDAPRYDIQQFGFYPIGSHFFFYKSMMIAMRWDNSLYDASTEILANKAMLEAEPPTVVSGSDKIDGSVNYPNAIVASKNTDFKATQLFPASNVAPLIDSLRMTEESMSDSSLNDTMGGQEPDPQQKAYSVAQAQSNAKKIISGVGKGLALSVSRYGNHMAYIAIHHLSTPQVEDIIGDETKLKYRKFILNNKDVGGQRMNKMLIFDESLIGQDMTPDQKNHRNLDLYSQSEKNKAAIYLANPELFARMKYLSRADSNELFEPSDQEMLALIERIYVELRQDPLVDPQALLREFMYQAFKSKGEKFIAKNPQLPPNGLPPTPPVPGQDGGQMTPGLSTRQFAPKTIA